MELRLGIQWRGGSDQGLKTPVKDEANKHMCECKTLPLVFLNSIQKPTKKVQCLKIRIVLHGERV